MSRPPVSVVVPFAGDESAARRAVAMIRGLRTAEGDELILADNSGTVRAQSAPPTVVRAAGERSPAHARNAGARAASGAWILFLDADTKAPPDLLDRYFETDVSPRVGALVGEIRPDLGEPRTLAARYAAQRNFLSQRAHLAHPYRPRAAAANLMVRREAFETAGGFREGLRAAEDTDLCWRLQALGWALELREHAVVEHAYRQTIGELRAQWRSYAAGRAWLAREYPDFHPQPALARAAHRAIRWRPRTDSRAVAAAGAGPQAGPGEGGAALSRRERAEFLALDAVLAVEELIGLRMENRPDPMRGASR